MDEVPKVVARMEAEPPDLLHQDQPRREHHLGKDDGVDAVLLVLFELDARVLQQVDAVLRVHVLGEVELEVELPGGDAVRGQVRLLVHESQTQLDDLEEVNVTAQKLVLVVGRRCKLT